MFYTAILLILVGLFSLSYLLFSLSVQRRVETESGTNRSPTPESGSAPAEGRSATESRGAHQREGSGPSSRGPEMALPQAASPDTTEKGAESRGDSAPREPLSGEPGRSSPARAREPARTNAPGAAGTPSRRTTLRPRRLVVDMQKLSDTVRALDARQATAPEESPPTLSVDGILFLDHDRIIPSMAGRLERLHPRFFSRMKRAGTGHMVLQGNVFHIHCGHTDHIYTSGDLEQILFLRKGVALIPLGRSQVIPVFITEESAQIREYIKRHTRVQPA